MYLRTCAVTCLHFAFRRGLALTELDRQTCSRSLRCFWKGIQPMPSRARVVKGVLAAGLRILQRPRGRAFSDWLHCLDCVSLFRWLAAVWNRWGRAPRLEHLLGMPHDDHLSLQTSGSDTVGQQTNAKVRSRKPIPGMLRVPFRHPLLRCLQGVRRIQMWHHCPCWW